MRRLVLLFTGFLLLSGIAAESLMPVTSIALNNLVASVEAQHMAPVRPQKRIVHLALKAIRLKKRREERLKDLQETILPPPQAQDPESSLLAVVDQKDILLHHQMLADEVLRALPQACLSSLKNFYVRYDNPSRRGLAGKSSIILDGSVTDDEFKALLIHEFGHITDLGCMQGYDNSRPSPFKDGSEVIAIDDPSVGFYTISWDNSNTKHLGSRSEDFVSGYASWDPFEDFAETFAYFVLQNEAFRDRARENPVLAAKYRWIAFFVFFGQPAIATGEHEWAGEVPWDVTKLAYIWHPPAELASANN